MRASGHILRKMAAIGGLAVSAVFASVPAAQANAGAFLAAKFVAPTPKAARDICERYDWACSHSGKKASLSGQDMELIRRVNRQVNRKTRPVSDQSQYRTIEHWALPTRRGGDCEDFALLKKRELIRQGIAPERLLIAKVLTRKRTGHAVLVVRTDQGDMVLDNLTNRIKKWQDTRYMFLTMQNPKAPESWVAVLQRGK